MTGVDFSRTDTGELKKRYLGSLRPEEIPDTTKLIDLQKLEKIIEGKFDENIRILIYNAVIESNKKVLKYGGEAKACLQEAVDLMVSDKMLNKEAKEILQEIIDSIE